MFDWLGLSVLNQKHVKTLKSMGRITALRVEIGETRREVGPDAAAAKLNPFPFHSTVLQVHGGI